MKVWALITHDRQDTRHPDIVTLWPSREAALAVMAREEMAPIMVSDTRWEDEFEIVELQELEVQS